MAKSLLESLYGEIDRGRAAEEEEQATTSRTTSAQSVLRKLREKREASKPIPGEDPRIADYYKKVDSPLMQALPPDLRARRQERLAREFYQANPDLDTRKGQKLITTADKQKKTADEHLQAVLRLAISGTEDPSSLRGRAALDQAAREYRAIKDQIPEVLRKKYNLEAWEKAGVLEGTKGGDVFSSDYWKQGFSEFVSTPGIKQLFHELGKPQQLVSASAAGLWDFLGAAKEGDFDTTALKRTARPLFRIGDPRTYMGDEGVQQEIGLHDNNGDGVLDLRDILDATPDATGNRNIGPGTHGEWSGVPTDAANRLAEFAWSFYGDPTRKVALGSQSSRVRAGMNALEKAGLDDIARQIRSGRGGWNSLSEVQRQAAREAIEAQVAEAIALGARDLGQGAAIERALLRGGKTGVRMGDRTILPTDWRRFKQADSAIDVVTTRVLPSEIQIGDRVPEFGGSRVTAVGDSTITIDPAQEVVQVQRGSQTLSLRPDEMQVGDKILDGDYTVSKALDGEGGNTLELESARGLIHAERPLNIFPRDTVGGQGTVVGRKTVDVDPQPPAQGKLFNEGAGGIDVPQAPSAAAEAAPRSVIDDAIERVKTQPGASDAGGYGPVVERQLAQADGRQIGGGFYVRSVDDGAGGRIVGLYDGGDDMVGYLMATDDAINTFESLTPTKGVGRKLLDAAEAEGLDVPALLANSDFTDAGRKSALGWLNSKKAAGGVPTLPDAPTIPAAAPGTTAVPAGTRPEPRLAEPVNDQPSAIVPKGRRRANPTVTVRRPTGGEQRLRPWYSRGGKRPIEADWEILGEGGLEVGSVVRYTDDGAMVLVPGRLLEGLSVGDAVPALNGRISLIDEAGNYHILPEAKYIDIFGEQRTLLTDVPEGTPAVSPVDATEGVPGPAVQGILPETQGGAEATELGASTARADRPLAPLTDTEAFPAPETAKIEVARRRAGRAGTAADDPQGKLFDRDVVDINDLGDGDWLPSLQGRVTSRANKRVFTAELDPQPRTILRDNVVDRVGIDELKAGDVLPDTGVKIRRILPDGKVELTPSTATRTEIRVQLGGFEAPTGPGRVTRAAESVAPSAVEAGREGKQFLGDLFSPRARVRRAERLEPGRVQPGTSERLYGARTEASTRTGNLESELQTRVSGAWDLIRKDLEGSNIRAALRGVARKKTPLTAQQVVVDALDVTKRADTERIIGALTLAGKTDAAEGIRRILRVHDEVRELAGDDVADALFTAKSVADERMPLILTEAGHKALSQDSFLRARLLQDKRIENLSRGYDFTDELGGAKLRIEPDGARTDFTDLDFSQMTAREINQKLSELLSEDARRALGLPEGEAIDLFETNPLTVYAMRGRSQFARAMEGEMIEQLAQPTAAGPGVLRIANVDDPLYSEAVRIHAGTPDRSLNQILDELYSREGLHRVTGYESPLGPVYAQPEVAREMATVRKVMQSEEELKKLTKAFRSINNTWARMRTSPITKGLGFQTRNLTTNTISSYMKGVADGFADKLPGGAGRALSHMKASRRVMKAVKDEGLSFAEAADKYITDPVLRQGLETARNRGIVREGFFRNLSYDEQAAQTAVRTSRKKAFAARLNPFDQDFALTRPGQVANELAEDFSRLTHFYAVLDHTGSVDEAVRSVRDTLFDYSDLTPFEQKYAKNINRFYTFMRKNLALQLSMLVHHPGLVAHTQRQISGLYGDPTGLLYPGEGEQGDATRAAGGFLNAIANQGKPGAVRLDTPLDAAMKAVDPAFQVAVYSIPGLAEQLPLSERPTPKSIANSLFESQVSGAPGEFLDILYGYRTGTDPRTGRPVDPADKGWGKLQDFLFPLWDQGQKSAEGLDDRAALLKLLTGVVYMDRSSEERQLSLQYANLRELEDLIAKLQAEGQKVPTITELRDAGLIPTQAELREPGERAPRTVPMPTDVRRDRARDALFN